MNLEDVIVKNVINEYNLYKTERFDFKMMV